MRKDFFVVFLLVFAILARSQSSIGVFGGVSNYVGDLSEKLYQNSRAAVGFTINRPISRRVSLRVGLTFGKVNAADSLNPREDFRKRNFSFQSSISELSL